MKALLAVLTVMVAVVLGYQAVWKAEGVTVYIKDCEPVGSETCTLTGTLTRKMFFDGYWVTQGDQKTWIRDYSSYSEQPGE